MGIVLVANATDLCSQPVNCGIVNRVTCSGEETQPSRNQQAYRTGPTRCNAVPPGELGQQVELLTTIADQAQPAGRIAPHLRPGGLGLAWEVI